MAHLKRAIIFVGLLSVSALAASALGQTNDIFRFTDGYFLGGHGPVHLIHDDAKPEIGLGDEYNLRLSFRANEGAPNPCSRREEKACRLIQQVIVKHEDGSEEFVAGWKEGLEFQADDAVGFGIPLITIPRTAPIGDVLLVVKMVKKGETIFRKEWPMKIW